MIGFIDFDTSSSLRNSDEHDEELKDDSQSILPDGGAFIYTFNSLKTVRKEVPSP
jgi:hypothetical protein